VGDFPSGTVTFLFTDIESSTRLLHELGEERYGAALTEHRRLLREAFERHGGVEVDTQGDAFFVAFASAAAALQAAEDARSRVGQWEDSRDQYAAHVEVAAGEAFERGRAQGRLLALDDAAEEALNADTTVDSP
jgi:class 3 adenylate cyclase